MSSKFQKRHYVALAKVIRLNLPYEDLVNELCAMLRADNPNFNEMRFRGALNDY